MKFKVLFIFLIVFAVNTYASLPPECPMSQASLPTSDNIISNDTFDEMFLLGSELDLTKDRTYYVKFDSGRGIVYQPVEIRNGMAFTTNYAVTKDGQKTGFIGNLFQKPLLISALSYVAIGTTAPFPAYPILVRANETEQLSLLHLTYLFESTVPAVKVSFCATFQEELERLESDALQSYFKQYLDAFGNFPKQYQQMRDMGLLGDTTSEPARRQFNKDKEELFSAYRSLCALIRLPLDEGFFTKIFETGRELDKTFFGGSIPATRGGLSTDSTIYKWLVSTHDIFRHVMARALLLSIVVHPDDFIDFCTSDLTPRAKSHLTYLTPSYGQIARFLNHITIPHVYKPGDLITINKSYWFLADGNTAIDLYKVLFINLVPSFNAYKINNVEISTDLLQSIVVDIEMNNLPDVVQEMKALDGSGGVVDTKGIRFVIRESGGYYVLVTAHPILLKNPTVPSKETPKHVFQALKYFYPERKFDGDITIKIDN